MEHRGYRYRDTPEGEDYFKKLIFISKYTWKYGTLASAYDIILISKPTGIASTLQRYCLVAGPVMCIGAAYVTSQTCLARARGGDYVTSAAISGAVCGAILGGFRGCSVVGSHAAIIFGILTSAAKYCHLKGYLIQEDLNTRMLNQEVGSGFLGYFNFSRVHYPEKGWIRAEDVESNETA